MKAIARLRVVAAAFGFAALSSCGPAPSSTVPAQASTPVRVEQAAASNRQQMLSAFGTIEISPDHSRTVSLPYDSIVMAVRAAAGQTVRAGAPILEVRPAPAAALEQRRAAEALRFARSDNERILRLRAQNLATNADLAAARQALANAEAAISELGAPLGTGRSQLVVAPIAGLIVTLDAVPGGVIPAGTPLARIGDAQQLQARLGVEIEDLSNIREGATTKLSDLQNTLAVQGRVSRVLRRVDPTTRLAEVTVALPVGATLLPGAPVRAEIAIGAVREVITTPRSALVYAGEMASVFVMEGAVARRKAVTLGAEFDDRIEVLSGIEIGASVIVDGAATLEDGARVAVQTAAQP